MSKVKRSCYPFSESRFYRAKKICIHIDKNVFEKNDYNE